MWKVHRQMPKFIQVDNALERIVENESVPVRLRYQALKEMSHPSLDMLRRMLVQHNGVSKASLRAKRKKPVPPKLLALATLRYKEEMHLRDVRLTLQRKRRVPSTNALGI